MKIVIIGGTGLIGSKLTINLRQLGHEVIAASPASGVNTITGEGLADVLIGTQVVVDVSNSPSFEDKAVMEFFETSCRNLLAAESFAGVKHHIALSVVGTDRLQQSGYFRAKQAQETLIKKSKIPFTIVHSTQFFEFLGGIVASATNGKEIHLSPASIQPISSDDVASIMTTVVTGTPVNGIIEIAGPEVFSLAELVQQYLIKIQDSRNVKADKGAPYFGAILETKTLIPEQDSRKGSITFEDWFKNRPNKS